MNGMEKDFSFGRFRTAVCMATYLSLCCLAICIESRAAIPDGKGNALPAATADFPAFPGAEGGGMYTTGGRSGRVLYVTSLADDGSEGTLRWAVNQKGARTILFKVGGVIRLVSPLKIKQGNVTIAGQTAPGEGICLRDYPVVVGADNVVVRFLRFRMGDLTKVQDDAFGGRYHRNIVIDHCSMSWSTDECASFYANENFTLQWCIVSESLNLSVHDKGAHGYGAIWGGKNASFHHNLLAHHNSRNPRFDHPGIYGDGMERGCTDYRNNVVYNWGQNSCYGGEGGFFNMVNNYYKPGPGSRSRPYFIITNGRYDTGKRDDKGNKVYTYPGHARLYLSGNYFVGDPGGINGDNRKGIATAKDDPVSTENRELDAPLPIVCGGKDCYVTTHSAQEAFPLVLAYAGASYRRDAIDERIAREAEMGTATCIGSVVVDSKGRTVEKRPGLIDTQADAEGWGIYGGSTVSPTADTDGDGMPDAWEKSRGLNGDDSSDGNLKTLDPAGRYTNLEVYLNSLVADLVGAQNTGGVYTRLR